MLAVQVRILVYSVLVGFWSHLIYLFHQGAQAALEATQEGQAIAKPAEWYYNHMLLLSVLCAISAAMLAMNLVRFFWLSRQGHYVETLEEESMDVTGS